MVKLRFITLDHATQTKIKQSYSSNPIATEPMHDKLDDSLLRIHPRRDLATAHTASFYYRPALAAYSRSGLMPLMNAWAPYFQSRTRLRGRTYYDAGGIKRLPPDPDELIRAEVTGENDTHTVTLSPDGPATTAQCTCDHTGGTYCPHVWATLMAVQNTTADFDQDAQSTDLTNPRPPRARKRRPDKKSAQPVQPAWATKLDLVRPPGFEAKRRIANIWSPHRQVCYIIHPGRSARREHLIIELRQRHPVSIGRNHYAKFTLNEKSLHDIPDQTDRELCALLLGAQSIDRQDEDSVFERRDHPSTLFMLPAAAQRGLLIRLIQTNRCFVAFDDSNDEPTDPLTWDGGEPWRLWLTGQHDVDDQLSLMLELRRSSSQILSVDQPDLVLGGHAGIVIHNNTATPFEDGGAYRWVTQFRDRLWSDDDHTTITVPAQDIPRFLDRLYLLPQLPRIDLPDDLVRAETHVKPVPHLELHSPQASLIPVASSSPQRNALTAKVWFAYNDQRVEPDQPGDFIAATTENPTSSDAAEETSNITNDVLPSIRPIHPTNFTANSSTEPNQAVEERSHQSPSLIRRDIQTEASAIASLWPLGFRQNTSTTEGGTPALSLPAKAMAAAVNDLISRGWLITADEKIIRNASPPSLSVASGIDWFELRGTVRYDTSYRATRRPAARNPRRRPRR